MQLLFLLLLLLLDSFVLFAGKQTFISFLCILTNLFIDHYILSASNNDIYATETF